MHARKVLLKQYLGGSMERYSPIFSGTVSLTLAATLMGLLISMPCRNLCAQEIDSHVADSGFLSVTTTNSSPSYATNPPSSAAPDETDQKFQEILTLERQGNYASALEKATAVVQAEPKNINAYIIRGHIYTEMNLLYKAGEDYQAILLIDPDNFSAKFNISEIKLMQKDYDNARPGFVALEKNSDWGDLAAYKVFLCDLFAGHDSTVQSEYDAFDKAGSNASYYYSKATWEFYHKRPASAQPWLDAAERIYPPKKVFFYSATLVELGYLPSPQQKAQAH